MQSITIPRILCLALAVSAFDLQMMSTRPRPRSVRTVGTSSIAPQASAKRTRIDGASQEQQPQKPTSEINSSSNGSGVTSALISRLAVLALKRRLAQQSGVKCDITASSSDLLLKQQVGPVTVRGRGWSSQRGLTCRAIEATVQTCELDMKSVISRQKLILTIPAKGDAMVALDGDDFANFITHPLMKPPQVTEGNGKISFIKEGVKVDMSAGSIVFYLIYDGEKYKCELRRGPDESARAIIDVYPASEFAPADIRDATSKMITNTVSSFFNEMVFELDGTYLTFSDMMVTEKGGGATVMLKLDLLVRKFPSPGLAF
mmetsp:Transcript_9043/g.19379  ORF Transcript_9043/g.19379 Transcript_9043/m.19379 type:complete len:317 (-) Transcript_9043:33-983(-)|eukprot:CAMPEP_0178497060 /NCGR_PEP_ID=MMETSP0696-20121128/14465_1 /TAXON_ID=265572 /ORGANISM="Extubocellulus spinifer, Strain CCMP396" /LENGTH=316 /DNA_ID=CAMNT_0020125417 /DNA_START=218 /DNA_END=1168 /DNA_ORIENTATION=-